MTEQSDQGTSTPALDDSPELCVLCKAETPYKKNTHVDHRLRYIEGSGQLCEKCFKETYEEEAS